MAAGSKGSKTADDSTEHQQYTKNMGAGASVVQDNSLDIRKEESEN
jgi:sulfate adenylyltransferase subunit 1 (EFTu-like GTPase family)